MTYIGIDVSKATLDVAVHGGPLQQVANDGPGIATVVAQLGALSATLIVLEATGVYHHSVTAALVAAQLPVAVESAPGARLRAEHRPSREDGSLGCAAARALCGGRAADPAARAG